jgi:hypothetical protein
MKTIILFFSVLGSMVYAQPAALVYAWKANNNYTFSCTQHDNIQTQAMGMQVNEQFITRTDFVLAIQSVDPSGRAKGKLYLLNYTVKSGAGNVLAQLSNLPKNAAACDITVDQKGHFTFPAKVKLITGSKANVLVYERLNEKGGAAEIQTENERVNVYAEFDPKTGALRAGYTVQNLTATRSVESVAEQESDRLNVYPYEFLEMMVLPEGMLHAGDNFKVTAGMYTIDAKVLAFNSGIAEVQQNIITSKDGGLMQGSAQSENQQGSISIDGLGSVQNMNLSSEDQNAMAVAQDAAPEINGTLKSIFDASRGMLNAISGTLTTRISMMGVSMHVVSKLDMKRK